MEVTIQQHELRKMLVEAARIGANYAIDDLVCYNKMDACERLGVTYGTLSKRIEEGKIRAVDGRITGAEIRRYLSEFGRKR